MNEPVPPPQPLGHPNTAALRFLDGERHEHPIKYEEEDPRLHPKYRKMVKRFLDEDTDKASHNDDDDFAFWNRMSGHGGYGGAHGGIADH